MSSRNFETLIRRTANRFGIDVHRHRPESSVYGRVATMLRHHRVDLLLDVGANVGQFANSIRDAGYGGRLISFEPLSGAHARLVRAARSDSSWSVARRMAIGDRDGEIEMKVSRNSYSSSALSTLPEHIAAAPDSACVEIERAPVMRLDNVAREFLPPDCKVFLKIDTQGYEDRVLDGATGILDRVVGMQLELSLMPLYEGQVLFDVIAARLQVDNFSLWGLWPGFHNPRTGRMLQVDAVFFRK